jgi:hypothetical protein
VFHDAATGNDLFAHKRRDLVGGEVTFRSAEGPTICQAWMGADRHAMIVCEQRGPAN